MRAGEARRSCVRLGADVVSVWFVFGLFMLCLWRDIVPRTLLRIVLRTLPWSGSKNLSQWSMGPRRPIDTRVHEPIWGRAVCSDSRPAPLRSAGEETHRAYPNVSDRRHVAFFCASFFQKTKAPARNADPRDIAFSWACFSPNIKAPARNATPRDIAFSWACFSQKTKAPARNADPRHIAFFLGMFFS